MRLQAPSEPIQIGLASVEASSGYRDVIAAGGDYTGAGLPTTVRPASRDRQT